MAEAAKPAQRGRAGKLRGKSGMPAIYRKKAEQLASRITSSKKVAEKKEDAKISLWMVGGLLFLFFGSMVAGVVSLSPLVNQ